MHVLVCEESLVGCKILRVWLAQVGSIRVPGAGPLRQFGLYVLGCVKKLFNFLLTMIDPLHFKCRNGFLEGRDFLPQGLEFSLMRLIGAPYSVELFSQIFDDAIESEDFPGLLRERLFRLEQRLLELAAMGGRRVGFLGQDGPVLILVHAGYKINGQIRAEHCGVSPLAYAS